MVKKFVVFVISLIPVTVLAGFQVVEEPVKPAASAPGSGSVATPPPKSAGGLQLVALSYIGEPDGDIAVLNGFGRDLKLLDAIKQIAPAGWQAFLKEDVAARADKIQGVSWKGGRRWTEVLDIVANDQQLAVEVDWTRKSIYVGDRKIVAREPAAEAATAQVWAVETGDSLRDKLRTWAKLSGWGLVWDYVDAAGNSDFEAGAADTYHGDFRTAVRELFAAMPAKIRIRAEFRSDNNPPFLYVTREEGVRQ